MEPGITPLAGAQPPHVYPLVFVMEANWRTTDEKLAVLESAGFRGVMTAQTLTRHPRYSDETVEEPAPGHDRGDYVGIVAVKPAGPGHGTPIRGGLAEILASHLRCTWDYYAIACALGRGRSDSRYQEWVQLYSDPAFGESAHWMCDGLDRQVEDLDDDRRSAVAEVFHASRRFELRFCVGAVSPNDTR